MPMYFPDLKSVRDFALIMAKHKGEKKYTGIIPETEKDVESARKQLSEYVRRVWKDEVMAMEVELAVTKENYEQKMRDAIRKKRWFEICDDGPWQE